MCLAGATKTGGIKREQSSNTTACTAYFEEVSVFFPLGFSKFNFQCLCSNKCSLGNCIQPKTL